QQVYEHPIVAVKVNDNDIELSKNELKLEENGVRTIYLLRMDNGIEPLSRRFGSAYDMLHNKLTAEGKLDHTLQTCPERLHPRPIRLWTPQGGWTAVPLKSGRAED